MVGTWVTCGASAMVAMVASMSRVLNSASVWGSNLAPRPLGSETSRPPLGPVGFDLALRHVPDHGGDVRPSERGDLPDAGRRGDVDLGEIVADHVDAGKDQPAPLELRPKPRANLLVALRERRGLGLAADMQIGARLAWRRHAVDRAGDLAIDQDDALVALGDLRHVTLHHDQIG